MHKYDYEICQDCGRDDCNGNCYDLPKELWVEVYGKEKANRLSKTIKGKYNFSKTIPLGRTVRTRDNYFEGKKDYIKEGYENAGNYRKAVVIDTNNLDEIALVKLLGNDGKKKGIELNNYQKGKSIFRTYVETLDDDNNPIKIGIKFEEQNPVEDLSKKDVYKIRSYLFEKSHHEIVSDNLEKIKKLKDRKK